MKILKYIVLVFVLIMTVVPMIVFAQLDLGFEGAEGIADEASLSIREPAEFIKDAINLALGLIGLIALAVLIYGGFLFITSSGDEDKAAKAKRLILYAIVGLLLIGASVIVVNLVIDLFSP